MASGIGDLLDEVFAALPERDGGEEEEPTPEEEAEAFEQEFEPVEGEDAEGAAEPTKVRKQRTHGEYEARETKVAIIGRPNVGKSHAAECADSIRIARSSRQLRVRRAMQWTRSWNAKDTSFGLWIRRGFGARARRR